PLSHLLQVPPRERAFEGGRLVRIALAAIALVALTGVASAQDAQVDVEAGWGGLYVVGQPAPVRVTVRVPSERPFEGTIVLEALPGERVPRAQVRVVATPASGGPAVGTASFHVPARTDESFHARLFGPDGKLLAEGRPRKLVSLEIDERLVVRCGASAPGLAALDSTAENPRVAPKRLQRLRVARVAPQAIPAHAWALEGVAAVVLADGPGAAELARDDARVAALASWVRSGGALLVTGG